MRVCAGAPNETAVCEQPWRRLRGTPQIRHQAEGNACAGATIRASNPPAAPLNGLFATIDSPVSASAVG